MPPLELKPYGWSFKNIAAAIERQYLKPVKSVKPVKPAKRAKKGR